MTPERWQQVNELFQAVADRTPDERTTFLQRACQGDEALLREVESLITSHESAENFIESPAFEIAPELLTKEPAGAIKGELIGRYRIESLVGVGGMGEVYLARDEQLGRKVALKFLPERLTADKTQLSRFKSEARTASALNHPNILTVYEIGTDGHRHFIATEFIEGETLSASLLAERMSVREALEIAVQVASALDAAHKAGVVHRDIKPDNIMLRPDGYVKLLDFGIAKLTEPRSASDVQDFPMTQTQAGLVLGRFRLVQELRESRSRLVAAQDLERRRIERNLHDGAQQRFVNALLALGMAEAGDGPRGDRREQIQEASREVQAGLSELRSLARGLQPPCPRVHRQALAHSGTKIVILIIIFFCALSIRFDR